MAKSKKDNGATYNFLTALCAGQKIVVKGKIEKPIKGTIKVFNEVRKSGEKFNNCSGKDRDEIFSALPKSITAYGYKMTIHPKGTVDKVYRVIELDKVPSSLI